ncbi:uncharacterized protein LOC117647506 [Thrips palmi]|uniref:Uncharacterized protein LOC117647506 n=1 Tax=Thrips palmi TaxID=161013 RepID=A0A6P8ZQ33_THRPL|nr:uncharacterized protein LOC117647506 [Thrips palmi]
MGPYDEHSYRDDDSDLEAPEVGRLQGRGGPSRPSCKRGPRTGGCPGRGVWRCETTTSRLVRLAAVCLLCPGVLLGWPLYMRYVVLRDLALPLTPSDMRVLDLQVSSTWCQAQVVRANASFNAWMVEGSPRRGRRQRVSLTRDISLDDDTKEYWGFYLLEGSSVTVSPCVRWPGVSLVVIKGYDHLLQCAYIGDDSSEEAEEVRRAALRAQLEQSRRYRPPTGPSSPPPGADGDAPGPEAGVSPVDGVPGTAARTASPGPAAPTTPKQRSNQPRRMQLVKETAVEFHEKARPPPKVFYKLDGLEDHADEDSAVPGASAEVARGMLERLRAMGATGRRALDHLRSARLSRELGRSDDNTAAEEQPDAQPDDNDAQRDDEVANRAPLPGEDVRGWVNETTSLDESHSELWSSFSSSEEALLGCKGLVLNLPLTPHRQCQRKRAVADLHLAAAPNVITYRVPSDGHYFFVLGSENEVQTNFVRVRFDLDKVVYDVDAPVARCASNSSDSGSCSLPLRFLSDDTLVLEVPVAPGEGAGTSPSSTPQLLLGAPHHQDHGHDHVVAVSTCEPRTALYVMCIIALPAIILACAF